jgi:hypothetical protein
MRVSSTCRSICARDRRPSTTFEIGSASASDGRAGPASVQGRTRRRPRRPHYQRGGGRANRPRCRPQLRQLGAVFASDSTGAISRSARPEARRGDQAGAVGRREDQLQPRGGSLAKGRRGPLAADREEWRAAKTPRVSVLFMLPRMRRRARPRCTACPRGSLNVGRVTDINWKHFRLLQRNDGYGYAVGFPG